MASAQCAMAQPPLAAIKPCGTFKNVQRVYRNISRPACLRQHSRLAIEQSSYPPQQLDGEHTAPGDTSITRNLGGMLLLGSLWVFGHSTPTAVAATIRAPQHLETVVTITPQASAATSVSSDNDSCSILVVVCLGFWMLSATISAGIGAVMKMTGRSMAYASGSSSAGWTTAGVMDTLDIMRLPLAYDEEPAGSSGSRPGHDDFTYAPWEGPDTYIPVNMVQVFQPGLLEAGRVVRQSMLQTDRSQLRIVSVTRPADQLLTSKLPTNGNGSHNGTNGKSSSNGSKGSTDSKQTDSSNE